MPIWMRDKQDVSGSNKSDNQNATISAPKQEMKTSQNQGTGFSATSYQQQQQQLLGILQNYASTLSAHIQSQNKKQVK